MKAVIGAFLKLMEDKDKDVRVAFSGQIKCILQSSDAEKGFIKEVNLKYFVACKKYMANSK